MPGICPRCQKNVYFNEEKIAIGKSWHVACFCCGNCKRRLDSHTLTEHNENIYCGACYKKHFGPKGYGYGGGAGVLSMDAGSNPYLTGPETSNIPATVEAYLAPLTRQNSNQTANSFGKKPFPKYGNQEICPRCCQPVYLAERMTAGGYAWHKPCYTCRSCNKHLESTTLCVREGEIYCKACYGKQFGPKGYGYGSGAGTLQTS